MTIRPAGLEIAVVAGATALLLLQGCTVSPRDLIAIAKADCKRDDPDFGAEYFYWKVKNKDGAAHVQGDTGAGLSALVVIDRQSGRILSPCAVELYEEY
jgi:hypothetical protein